MYVESYNVMSKNEMELLDQLVLVNDYDYENVI